MIPLQTRAELAFYLDGINRDPAALPPQLDDLYTLYQVVRMTGVVSALELGSGWSTLVLALAVDENAHTFAYDGRHPDPFTVHTVDASADWQMVALERMPPVFRGRVRPTVAPVEGVEWAGRRCNRFAALPTTAVDLIYIDGPDPDQVASAAPGPPGDLVQLDGHDLHPDEHPWRAALPMSADLLHVEPHLWPDTVVVVDGRTANARFLAANLQRTWQVWEDPFGDRTWFRLAEPPLGRVSRHHLDLRRDAATLMREGGRGAPWGRAL